MSATEALNPPIQSLPSFTERISKPSVKSSPCQTTYHCRCQLLLCSTVKHIDTHYVTYQLSVYTCVQVVDSMMWCHWIVFLKGVCVYVYCRNEPAYITMLAPFLRYLYCEPQRQPQHALLRHSLLRALVPVHPGAGSHLQKKDQRETSPVSDSLLHCLCQLVPHMQVKHWC